MCSCGSDIESTMHFLLHCQNYSSIRLELLNSIYALHAIFKQYSDEKLLEVLLYGSDKFDIEINRNVLKCTIKYLKMSGRFDNPLF